MPPKHISIALMTLALLTSCAPTDATECIYYSKDDVLTVGTARQILVIDKQNGC